MRTHPPGNLILLVIITSLVCCLSSKSSSVECSVVDELTAEGLLIAVTNSSHLLSDSKLASTQLNQTKKEFLLRKLISPLKGEQLQQNGSQQHEQKNTEQGDTQEEKKEKKETRNELINRKKTKRNDERGNSLNLSPFNEGLKSDEQFMSNDADIGDDLKSNKRRSIFARASGYDAQCEPKQAAIFGLRCNEGAEIHNGVLVIRANEATDIMLIGRNFDPNMTVALTPSEGSAQDDCTHTDRVKTLALHNVSANVALVTVNLPSPGEEVPFYLCLRDSSGQNSVWHHQGSQAWLKLLITQDLLPLYMKIIVIASLLLLTGLFSGLNLGLMSLDKNELQVIISCGNETEKRYARAIEPVRRRGNYLLCSILFSNTLINSTIAVLLEELTSGIVAVMTSTIFIVMFGEILPQAFCSRHGLAVGAKTVSITYFCMIVTFPLSYPISSMLDWALGEEIGHAYDRERLMEFIRVTRAYNNLETDEVNIISGALKLKRIQLSEVMTKIEDVFMLDVNSVLDFDTIQAIVEKGYSRIPVHEANNKRNIVALLFAKDLALIDPDDRTPVQTLMSFYNHPIMYLFEDTTLDLALNEFKTGKSHLAFVRRVMDDGDRDPVYEITGIVTLEDVIEEIIQMEINDETDTLTDNRRKRRRKEAQVRKDFSQFTNLGAGDSSLNVVSPQLCLAAYQYLATTVEQFSSKFISDSILRRLLSQKIYYKVRVDDTRAERRLYTSGEPVDYFIMILEGKVHVVCGNEKLVFDGGAFTVFGRPALAISDPKASITSTDFQVAPVDKQPTLIASPDNQLTARKESSTIKVTPTKADRRESVATKSLSGKLSVSMRKLAQPIVGDQDHANQSPVISNANQLTGPRLKAGDSRASIISADTTPTVSQFHIIPDYTVEIVANTSYLKITRNEYLTAVRATLVEREGGGTGLGGADDESSIEMSVFGPPFKGSIKSAKGEA